MSTYIKYPKYGRLLVNDDGISYWSKQKPVTNKRAARYIIPRSVLVVEVFRFLTDLEQIQLQAICQRWYHFVLPGMRFTIQIPSLFPHITCVVPVDENKIHQYDFTENQWKQFKINSPGIQIDAHSKIIVGPKQ